MCNILTYIVVNIEKNRHFDFSSQSLFVSLFSLLLILYPSLTRPLTYYLGAGTFWFGAVLSEIETEIEIKIFAVRFGAVLKPNPK